MGTASGDPLISDEFSASRLWAPPVATQFSILSQCICTYIHAQIHTYKRTYIHAYMYIYSHMYTHMYIPTEMSLFRVHFIASFLWAPPVATQFSVVRAPPVPTLVRSFHFITSFLWAPPVATQFSVLSQTFVKVGAPPVATL